MNYKIIHDEEAFRAFIEWLPDLEPGEVFYGCLFARKKYDTTGVIRNDKEQLKRFTSTKDRIYQKVRQLECEVGAYQVGGEPIPQDSLALYIMPNPRSLIKATQKTLVELSNILISSGGENKNPYKIALSQIQKNASRKVFIDFDFDDKIFCAEHFTSVVNPECLSVLRTRGGFHILVETGRVHPWYKKIWYNKVSAGSDTRGDALMPVPGCIQGGHVPSLKPVEDPRRAP